MSFIKHALIGGAVALLLPIAAFAESLTVQGAKLDTVSVDPTNPVIEKMIDVGSDTVTATYVIGHASDNMIMQRTRSGHWIKWDGDKASLQSNGFKAVGDQIKFKILKEDLSGVLFPLTISVAYRTANGQYKSGAFMVLAD